MDERYDVGVVGGGLAGLAAAATAARSGASVVLFEGTAGGGRAATTDHHGYRLNQGPHGLYRAGAGHAVLRRLGLEPRGAPPVTKPVWGLRNGEVHLMPVGLVSLVRSGLLTGAGARIELVRLMRRITRRRFDPGGAAGLSFGDWLAANAGHHDVADLLRTLVRLKAYAGAPDGLDAVDASVGSVVTPVHFGGQVARMEAIASVAATSQANLTSPSPASDLSCSSTAISGTRACSSRADRRRCAHRLELPAPRGG